MRITANEITNCLVAQRWHASFCLPRYTPSGWWECDVLEVTKAGYWHEYEIKTSRADFLADAKKAASRRMAPGLARETVTKHTLLETGSTKGPNRFTFVCADGVASEDEIPEWAGFKIASRKKYGLFIQTIKEPPRLHNGKFEELVHAKDTCYYRFHRACRHHDIPELTDGEGI